MMSPQDNLPDPPVFDVIREEDFEGALEDWAGEKIFKRGKDYFLKNRVSNLVVADDAKLLATVGGSRNYISSFYLDENDGLTGECTCPYDDICKHIVAVALAARAILQENRQLPVIGEFDSRPAKLAGFQPETTPAVTLASLGKALARLPKDDLLDLLLYSCEHDNDILQMCALRADPEGIGMRTFLSELKKEIAEAASTPDFDDDYSSGPDYYSIAEKLHILLTMGKPDTVLDFAKKVFDTCDNAIEFYDHNGQIIDEVGAVAEAGLGALREIGWPLEKKLLWAINAVLQDDFGYCECFDTYLEEISDASVWAGIADYLAKPRTGDSGSWKKSVQTRLLKLALEKSGHADELLKLYEVEAQENNDYLKLVDYLFAQGRKKDAETWIKKGLEAPRNPYDARNLLMRLIGIRQEEGNLDAVIALQTGIFVDFPDVREYEACAEAARAPGQWEALKPLLAQYLSDGKLPWLDKAWPFENKCASFFKAKKFPLYAELIELALYENRPLDALAWYDRQIESKHDGYAVSKFRIAEAVKDVAPGRAFEIWQDEVESLLASANTGNYFEAGRFLEKILALATEKGDKEFWQPYLRSLRERHKRKKNFIRILDAIEQGKNLNADILR